MGVFRHAVWAFCSSAWGIRRGPGGCSGFLDQLSGVEDLFAVVNHTAGGYLFYKSPEHHRITRFRPNGVPMDRPGHYIYLRDDDTGAFWSVSRQPCGGDLNDYRCRHGLSYSVYECRSRGIGAAQTLLIPRGENVELWDLNLENQSGGERHLSVYSYAEFSYHQIPIDHQNCQMSLYCAGSSYAGGVIDYELFYEHAHQFMTSSFEPDGFECLRDAFIGPCRDEQNPLAVEEDRCRGSFEKGNNHCAVLRKKLTLAPGASARLLWMLGYADGGEGTIYDHLKKILDFSAEQVGSHGGCKGLRADWNDCLNLGGGESAMVSFLHVWALGHFVDLVKALDGDTDAAHYQHPGPAAAGGEGGERRHLGQQLPGPAGPGVHHGTLRPAADAPGGGGPLLCEPVVSIEAAP